MPLVFFDRVCEEVETAKVLTDDFQSSCNATKHLISRGCREIVFLSAAGDLSIVDQRREGFLKAVNESNIEIADHHVVLCSKDESESMVIIQEILKRKKRIDGVVASIEKLAMQTYSACHAAGLSIPRDVKVIAFSNLPIAALLAPPLSTVVQPAFEMGKAAATLLFKSLAKKINLHDERIILPSVICERESTA
jgi:LacI family transcriptional regulator